MESGDVAEESWYVVNKWVHWQESGDIVNEESGDIVNEGRGEIDEN